MVTTINAGPYASRQVRRAGNGQPTTVIYQDSSYSSSDARECARHGMNVAGIKGKPVRQVAFAWGKDNVDVAAIQSNPQSLGNPWADCYSVRDGKPVQPANFCSRELEQLVEEFELTARLATHQTSPRANQWLAEQHFIHNSYDAPLVVEVLASFPPDIDAADYARAGTEQLKIGSKTSVAVVFAYGTNASGKFGPAADILAFGKNQSNPENLDADLHTIVGQKTWPVPGICLFEARVAVRYVHQFSHGIEEGEGRNLVQEGSLTLSFVHFGKP